MNAFKFKRVGFAVVGLLAVGTAQADVFNMPSGDTSLQFVTVGDSGNVPDPATGFGAVGYVYQMGKYDVTAAQYADFLSAVATTSDPYGLYNPSMSNPPTSEGTVGCGIIQSSSLGGHSYSVVPNDRNFPVNFVSWGDAARFCNWLQNGQPTGSEGNGTTETGAYTLNGGTSDALLLAVTRSSTATFVIPTENEWYKAAYYVGGGTNAGYWSYATQSNTVPNNKLPDTGNNANFYTGYGEGDNTFTDPASFLTSVGGFPLSRSAYGTFDQNGDVYQWDETVVLGSRGVRGGAFRWPASFMVSTIRSAASPEYGNDDRGFRVAVVPEPGSLALLLVGAVGLLAYAWRRRQAA